MPTEPEASVAKEERVRTVNEERQAMQQEERTSRSKLRRQQALEVANEESLTSLEQIFDAKLAAVRSYEQRLSGITDPYARQALRNMIDEERNQLLHLADLIEMVEQGSNMGGFSRKRRQISHRLKSGNSKSFAYGIGLAVIGALLYPTVKEVIRPAMAKAMEGIMDLSEHAQGLVSNMKENMEDFVAEAEFERLKESIDTEIDNNLTDPEKH